MSFRQKLEEYAGGYEPAAAYLYHRQRGAVASVALQRTKADLIAGTKRYPRDSGLGTPFGDALRWVQNPTDIGLRFVGFADELAGRAIDHTGWYTDTDGQQETLRGAVYQWPARNGRPLYVAAYREGSFVRSTWQDANAESAVIGTGDTFVGEVGGEQYPDRDHYGAHRDAAYRADRLAEIQAESAREYNDAWQAANRWQDLGEHVAQERATARQLIRDMRAAIKDGLAAAPSICSALRSQVRAHLATMGEAIAERREIAADFAYWDTGRRVDVETFAAVNL